MFTENPCVSRDEFLEKIDTLIAALERHQLASTARSHALCLRRNGALPAPGALTRRFRGCLAPGWLGEPRWSLHFLGVLQDRHNAPLDAPCRCRRAPGDAPT
jgi:hypothetical protein